MFAKALRASSKQTNDMPAKKHSTTKTTNACIIVHALYSSSMSCPVSSIFMVQALTIECILNPHLLQLGELQTSHLVSELFTIFITKYPEI